MGNKIALGAALGSSISVVVEEPLTIEERVTMLQKQVEELIANFHLINSARIKDKRQQNVYDKLPTTEINKDGIPIGISLVGSSSKNGIHILTVNADGYYIGITKFESLSAAAEAASGIRRSGWTYWKTSDNMTVKEAFGKRKPN